MKVKINFAIGIPVVLNIVKIEFFDTMIRLWTGDKLIP